MALGGDGGQCQFLVPGKSQYLSPWWKTFFLYWFVLMLLSAPPARGALKHSPASFLLWCMMEDMAGRGCEAAVGCQRDSPPFSHPMVAHMSVL